MVRLLDSIFLDIAQVHTWSFYSNLFSKYSTHSSLLMKLSIKVKGLCEGWRLLI